MREASLHAPAESEVSVISRRLKVRTAAALAAVAVLAGLLLVRPSQLDEESAPPQRDEATGVEVVPSLRGPGGVVAAVESFQWSQVPAADLYRITVYDAEGAVVWEAETRDTLITPPDSTEFEPDARYIWAVCGACGF